MNTFVWFNLLMISSGHVYWLGAFETYEECHAVQVQYEEQRPKDIFYCPYTKVELI